MKICILLLSVLTLTIFSYGQESVGHITFEKRGDLLIKKRSNTLDSTFIYTYDTLSLPILDDFSSNKFQAKPQVYTGPNVSSQNYYRLTNMSNVALPANAVYTSQVTQRRIVQNGASTEQNLTPIQIKVSALSSFPITYTTVNAYPPYYIYDTLDFVNEPDTVYINNPEYLQDSVRIFSVHVQDQNAIWTDNFAYRNYTHAVLPWTLGVATFDGLNEFGYPYDFGSSSVGTADYLTSKQVDLSGNVPIDSVYLTFLVQTEGYGDEPEASDSIVLELYNPVNDAWDYAWGMKGQNQGNFKIGHVAIKNAAYFSTNFKFRFINVGGLSGMLDEFHLDYVYLREGSGFQDTLLKDFAFVYPISSLIKDYTQVPYEHWQNDPTHMNDEVKVVVRNGSNIQENNPNGSVEVKFQAVTEGNFVLPGNILSDGDLNYEPRTTYFSTHDFTGAYSFSTGGPEISKTFDVIGVATAPFPNLASNDTSYTKQVFDSEYAYDDGSAEAAYGLIQTQARLAMRYTPYEADSLIALKMNFVPSVNDVSDKLFLISIWSDNNGVPGSLIYQDDLFNPRTPVYEDGIGIFTIYRLPEPVYIPDAPFYVGWRQIDADRLNIGLDRNIDNHGNLYYSLNGGTTWVQSQTTGSVMMRPVFQTASSVFLSLDETSETIETVPTLNVYPNPVNEVLNVVIEEDNFEGAQLLDLNGRVLLELSETSAKIDFSSYSAGMYFIHLKHSGLTKKVMH